MKSCVITLLWIAIALMLVSLLRRASGVTTVVSQGATGKPGAAGITEVGNNTAIATSSAPSITHGLTIASGDVVICIVHANGSNTATDNNGVNAMTRDYEGVGAASNRFAIFSRVAGGSEPSSYAFTLTASDRWTVHCRVFRGVDATIWDVTPGAGTRQDSTADTSVECPDMTTATNGALGIIIGIVDSNTATLSSPTNSYANLITGSSNQTLGSATRIFSTAGATGAASMTISATIASTGVQIALKPD